MMAWHQTSHMSYVNSLWSCDAIWRQRTESTLAQVMACCLTAPSHYLNQCWLVISAFTSGQSHKKYIDGILPKWPYPPCLRMADRSLLAGYSRCIPGMLVKIITFPFQPYLSSGYLNKIIGNLIKCILKGLDINYWTWWSFIPTDLIWQHLR